MTTGHPTPRMVVMLVLASLASGAVTALAPHLLTGPPAMNGSAKGTALVASLAGVPVLVIAYRQGRRGSLAELAVAAGAAAYLVYNAMLLAFATPFNRAFPLYEAMLGIGIWTLVRLVVEIWDQGKRPLRAHRRWPAVLIVGVVALNLVAWASSLVPALVSEHPRSMLAGTGLTTNPVTCRTLPSGCPRSPGWLWACGEVKARGRYWPPACSHTGCSSLSAWRSTSGGDITQIRPPPWSRRAWSRCS